MPTLAMIHTVSWYDQAVLDPFAKPRLAANPDVTAMDKLAKKVDAIVLRQISLAQIRHDPGVPVFQVGHSGFAEARRLLGSRSPKSAAARPASMRTRACS